MSADLHRAIQAHDLDSLARLLAAGDDPNELDTKDPQFSPLQAAIDEIEFGGDIKAVALLLQHEANSNLWNGHHTTTPLLHALLYGQREAALMLLAAGADPNVKSEEGDTPLALSVKEGDLKMAETLLRAGAAKTIDDSTGLEWRTALGHAAYRLDLEIIRLLLTWGASIDATDSDRCTARERLPDRTDENAVTWDLAFKLLSPMSSV